VYVLMREPFVVGVGHNMEDSFGEDGMGGLDCSVPYLWQMLTPSLREPRMGRRGMISQVRSGRGLHSSCCDLQLVRAG